MTDEFEEELFREMLNGVETEALQFQLRADPHTPFLDIFLDFWVGEVDVGEHEVVVICVFTVDVLGPFFVVADDLVDGLLLA